MADRPQPLLARRRAEQVANQATFGIVTRRSLGIDVHKGKVGGWGQVRLSRGGVGTHLGEAEERHPSTLHRMSHVKGFLCAVNLNLGLFSQHLEITRMAGMR